MLFMLFASMTKVLGFLFALNFLLACNHNKADQEPPSQTGNTVESRLYFKNLSDSLSVFVRLPQNYSEQSKDRYPVLYLLDANLYFDIMASVVTQYAAVGLCPEVILVGIGYKDFQTMDSLRNRDYTYPTAIPEYEMSTSGGGQRFLSAVTNELIPHINSKYKTQPERQILAGHSLGGYFSAFALQQKMAGAAIPFYGYIAASPSMHYNHYYLLNQFEKITGQQKADSNPIRAYFTFGGLEDTEDTSDPSMIRQQVVVNRLKSAFELKKPEIEYKGDVFSNLDHMDTQIPTFVKGLQWILQ